METRKSYLLLDDLDALARVLERVSGYGLLRELFHFAMFK